MQRILTALCVFALVRTVSAQELEPPLIFHAGFDGALEATAAGNGTPSEVEGPVEYRPGRIGQALVAGDGGATLHYETAGNLSRIGEHITDLTLEGNEFQKMEQDVADLRES